MCDNFCFFLANIEQHIARQYYVCLFIVHINPDAECLYLYSTANTPHANCVIQSAVYEYIWYQIKIDMRTEVLFSSRWYKL